MTTIVKRIVKGSTLTVAELDANVNNLNNTKLETTGGTLTGLPVLANQDVDIISPVYPTTKPSLNLDFTRGQLDPRITFVRNSTATYYDGQTTAMAEQNLLLQSNAFTTSPWTIAQVTSTLVLTPNAATAPDGTTTATTAVMSAVTIAGSSAIVTQPFSSIAGNTYSLSVYLQGAVGGEQVYIALTSFSSTQNANIKVTLTTGWQRFTLTGTATASTFFYPYIGNDLRYGGTTATSAQTFNFCWGQLEQRSSATAYTKTTTAAITNYIPVLLSAPAGVARFDCDPITGKSLGLLIEESRTNLLRYSVGNGASWNIRIGALVTTANAQVAPDGTITATQLTKTAITDASWQQAFTAVAGVTYTASAYFLKTSSVNVIEFAIRLSFIGGDYSGYLSFDTLTGNYAVRSSALANVTIVDCGRYWRILITSVTTSGTLSDSTIIIRPTTGVIVGGFNVTAIGSCIFWGAQLEAGSFATSYIPTVASTVTRARDFAYLIGSNFSSWYNNSQGSFLVDCDAATIAYTVPLFPCYGIAEAVSIGYVFIQTGAIKTIAIGGATNATLTSGTAVINTPFKAITSYTTTSISLCSTNGTVQTVTIPSAIVNDRLVLGGLWGTYFTYNGHIRKLSYYPIALSSSNLVALTS